MERRSALRIAIIYAFVAFAWITFSDRVVELLVRDLRLLSLVQTVKGGLFVVTTSFILWLLITRALDRLESSERRYHVLFQASQDAVFVIDETGRFLDANDAAIALCGYPIAELRGKQTALLFPKHTNPELLWGASPHRSGGAAAPVIQEQLSTKRGTSVPVELTINPLSFDQQPVFACIVRDVSMQQKSRADLEQSEQRFQTLFEAAPVGIATSRKGQTVSANPAYLRLFGFDDISEIAGTSLLNQIAQESRTEIIDRNRRREGGGEVLSAYETVGLRKDGSTFNFLANVARIELAEGPTTLVFVTDITARKLAEETLRVSERTNRALLNAIPDLMFRINRQGHFVAYESAATMQLLAQPTDFVGQHIGEVLPTEVAEQALQYVERVAITGEMQRFEYALPRGEGDIGEYEARLVKCGDDEVLAIVRDITERNRMERTLRDSEARQQAILHGTTDTIFLKDRLGHYLVINRPGAAIFNRSIEEIVGRTDGDLFPAEIAQALACVDREVMESGQSMEVENTFDVKGQPRTFLVVKAPFRHSDGSIHGVIGVARDITERKRQEQVKDDFLALASHELKTPLAALLGYVYLVERWSAKQGFGSRVDQALAAMTHEGQRLDRLINDLLDVSRIQTGRLQMHRLPIELRSYLERAVTTMQLALPNHPILLDDRSTGPIMCLADPQRLEQVLSNLLTNAAKYSPDGAPIYVELEAGVENIELAVRDTGLGIPEADLPLIFDRFYQVQRPRRESRPGMGLGLFITREIVRQHGGRLDVESREAVGSRFVVRLPTAATPTGEVILDGASAIHSSS